MMKAARIHQAGAPDVFKYEDVNIPEPGPNQVLVRNKVIGLNFIDTYQRSGLYQVPMPAILGREGAGIIEKVGKDVKDLKQGDRVAYIGDGSYADYTVANTLTTFKLPDQVSLEDAAAVLLQGLTAYCFMTSTYSLGPGKTCLIHAAAGGLGQLFVQFAKILGATVIATASSTEKLDIAKKLGADHLINYVETDFHQGVKSLTNGRGVDVVYDGVGKTTWEGSMQSLAPLGMMILCGNASGHVPLFDPFELTDRSLYLTRPILNTYIALPGVFRSMCTAMFGWLTAGKFKISEPLKVPLTEAAKAHSLLENRLTTGKVILIP